MATVSELSRRANDLVARLCDGLILDDHNADEAADLIEQALLAERRLAMEEAAKIADGHKRPHMPVPSAYLDACEMFCPKCASNELASALRAAAEKEVGNG